jgi:hypothetical protein
MTRGCWNVSHIQQGRRPWHINELLKILVQFFNLRWPKAFDLWLLFGNLLLILRFVWLSLLVWVILVLKLYIFLFPLSLSCATLSLIVSSLVYYISRATLFLVALSSRQIFLSLQDVIPCALYTCALSSTCLLILLKLFLLLLPLPLLFLIALGLFLMLRLFVLLPFFPAPEALRVQSCSA